MSVKTRMVEHMGLTSAIQRKRKCFRQPNKTVLKCSVEEVLHRIKGSRQIREERITFLFILFIAWFGAISLDLRQYGLGRVEVDHLGIG